MLNLKRAVLALACAAVSAFSLPAFAGTISSFDGEEDLGNPTAVPPDPIPGSSTSVGGTFTVTGGGNDWWDGGEFGHILYTAVTGDYRIESNVAATSNPANVWFKAGVFFRNNLDTGTGNLQQVNALMAVTNPTRTDPSARQSFQYRLATTSNMGNTDSLLSQPNDGTARVALQRRWLGNTWLVEGFYDDGDGNLNRVGYTLMSNLANNAFAGLAVTSHDTTRVDTAAFTNVQTVTPFGQNPYATSSLTPRRALNTNPGFGAPGQFSITEVSDNGTMNTINDAGPSLDSGAGTRRSYTRSVINILDSGNDGHFGNNGAFGVVADGTKTAGSIANLALIARTGVIIPTTGVYTFGVNSDDGFELSIDGGVVTDFANGRGAGDSFGSVYLTAGVHDLNLLYDQGTGGSEVELFAANGAFSGFDASMQLVGDTANGGLAIGAVPEPTSMMLLVMASGAALVRRRRIAVK
jgi:hypothetical protein